ncbi:hypothetical protein R1flu_015373 [Riccia fluitans]|uniref:Uncharacterized protein n=1 Tax=Riccia fluitans TaxID=41844 RepID=A0ABD1YLW3_9MARC
MVSTRVGGGAGCDGRNRIFTVASRPEVRASCSRTRVSNAEQSYRRQLTRLAAAENPSTTGVVFPNPLCGRHTIQKFPPSI